MRALNRIAAVLALIVLLGCQRVQPTRDLQHAAARGSASEVRRHLAMGADIEGKDRGGWTALALAAHYGRADVARTLIDQGAELDRVDSNPNSLTPLSLAARRGKDDVIAVLLDAGADPEVRGELDASTTAMESAVEGRHLSTVRLLLEMGVSPNGDRNATWPPLARAAINNDVAIIHELLEHGAGDDPETLQLAASHAAQEASTEAYETLVAAGAEPTLLDAAGAGSVKMVARLLEEGADPDGSPNVESFPLYAAAMAGHARIAQMLVEAGADTGRTVEGWSSLAAAVASSHDDVVSVLLDAGADINSREGHPWRDTPLEIAVGSQSLSTVQLLLDRGAAVGPPKLSYWPIIVEAAREGDAAIVSLLLDHGAGESPGFVQKAAEYAAINGNEDAYRVLADHGARPTLKSAAALGHEDEVRALLAAGTDPDGTGALESPPLNAAAGAGHIEIVRMLLEAGADPEQGTRYTALGVAAAWGQREIVEALVEAGADLNGRGEYDLAEPPLNCAIQAENAEMVDLLLALGADPTLKDQRNWSALAAAARAGNTEILKALLDAAAYTDADKRLAAEQALESGEADAYDLLVDSGIELTLPLAVQQGDLVAVKRLIGEGADLNALAEDGDLPLAEAAEAGRADIVAAMLEAGADVNATDRWDVTALHLAAREGHTDVARLLLEAGADLSANDSTHGTPLHEAARGGHLEMIRLLLASGADPNARSGFDKRRPLHDALWADDPVPVIELLVKLGADPDAMTEQKVTPLNEAAKSADAEAVRALLKAGADPDLENSGGNSARDLAEMFEFETVIEAIEEYD